MSTSSKREGLKLAGAYIDGDKYTKLVALAVSNNCTLAEQCRVIFDAAISNPASIPDAPSVKKIEQPVPQKACDCWKTVNTKLAPMGVKLSEKLRTFSPSPELDLKLVHQLPTEPLGAGKFKASMPRYIGFPRCPFCGQAYESQQEAA